ncbi:MAG: tetratricopeptide repeat protein [Desulfobacteraceae bacterium]
MDRRNPITKPGLLIIACLALLLLTATQVAAQYVNEKITDVNDPNYWLDRGGLYATYGSYNAAIKAYEKALALDADNSKAFFNRGLSYAELGDLNQALVDINKAISIDPTQGSYYYGRGRVLLLSSKKDRALEDFNKAAELGDLDAISYLQAHK